MTTAAGHTTLSTFTYTLDPVGNRTSVTGTNPATYTYDNRDRLTSVCMQSRSRTKSTDPYIAWTYDPVGNRLTETRGVGGTTTTYTYNEDDQLLTAGSSSYSYDHNGNQTQAGSRTNTYNAANQLATTTSGSTTDTYTYDGDGNRQTDSTGSTTTRYAWDTNHPLVQLAMECSGTCSTTSNLIRRYTIGNDTPGNDTISLTTVSGTLYYHYDGEGNTTNVTNASGTTNGPTRTNPSETRKPPPKTQQARLRTRCASKANTSIPPGECIGAYFFYLQGHTKPLSSATFSSAGDWIATGSEGGTASVFRCDVCRDLHGLQQIATERLDSIH